MTETPALNYQEAVANFGGDKDMFLQFLGEWEEMGTSGLALRLHKGIMKEDSEEIRIGSHILLSGAAYIGATRKLALLETLQARGERKDSMNLILKDYMELLNETRKVKREIAKILKRPVSVDLADFDVFEKQIRTVYSEYFPESNVRED